MEKPTGNPFTDLTLALADRIEQVVSEMEEQAKDAPPYMQERVSLEQVRRLLAQMTPEQMAQAMASLPPELQAALMGGPNGTTNTRPVRPAVNS